MEIQLRVVLLGVGVLILLVVAYDFFRRTKDAAGDSDFREKFEPKDLSMRNERRAERRSLDDYVEPDIYQTSIENDHLDLQDLQEPNLFSAVEAEPVIELIDDYEETLQEKQDPTQHIITVTIVAREQYGFDGAQLLEAMKAAELEFAANSTFIRSEDGECLFTVVNAMEPGYFILETLNNEHVPGITMILLPDEVSDPALAFDKLIRTAKQIAFALNGELLDHFKLPLTLETIEQYRQEVEAVTERL